MSGLPCDRFCFEGFPPRKQGERRARFAALAAEPRTLVLFEAPHRRRRTPCADLAAAFGADRPAALCRELTKTYEEIRRGTLGELAEDAASARGEITLVVGGAPPVALERPTDAALSAAVADLVATGTSKKDAITEVATRYGLPRREVYAAAHA